MADGLSPLLFQFLEATAGVVAKPIEYTKPLLRLFEACVLLVKFGLVKLLETLQELFERLGGVNENRPLAIADDELVHSFTCLWQTGGR